METNPRIIVQFLFNKQTFIIKYSIGVVVVDIMSEYIICRISYLT